MIEPSFIREALVWLFFAAMLAFAAYQIGSLIGFHRGFREGHDAGRADERTYLNARVCRAWGHAFRDGVAAGMSRAAKLFHELGRLPR